jgi:hypothetical protein
LQVIYFVEIRKTGRKQTGNENNSLILVCFLRGHFEGFTELCIKDILHTKVHCHCERGQSWNHLQAERQIKRIRQMFFLDFCPLNMVPLGCPETSTQNYHYTLCNNPEECQCHFISCLHSLNFIYLIVCGMYGFGADCGQEEYSADVGCVKGGGFFESRSNCELVKKGFAYHEVSVIIVV